MPDLPDRALETAVRDALWRLLQAHGVGASPDLPAKPPALLAAQTEILAAAAAHRSV